MRGPLVLLLSALPGVALAQSGPDLTVQSVVAPPSVARGEFTLIEATIANVGTAIAVGFDVEIRLQPQGLSLGVVGPFTLGPGGALTVGFDIVIPAGVPLGQAALVVIVDSNLAVAERLETNNIRGTRVLITDFGPDLQGRMAEGSSSPLPQRALLGETVTALSFVTNVGQEDSPPCEGVYYLSVNGGADLPLASFEIPALPTGSPVALQTSFPIPFGTPSGRYRVLLIVDAGLVVDEVDESNNGYLGPELEIVDGGLVILTRGLPPGRVGESYAFQLAAAQGAGSIVWTMDPIPPGMSLEPRSGIFSGTPVVPGQYRLLVTVEDGREGVGRELQWQVTTDGLGLVEQSLPDAIVGRGYEWRFEAVGGTPPLMWFMEPTPPGLSLDRDGVLRGVPSEVGAYPMRVQVLDAEGRVAFGVFELRVLDDASGPKVVRRDLPPGVVGREYCGTGLVQLQVIGGTPPMKWDTADAEPLPPGLTLRDDGVLCGEPTASGNFPFVVRVLDATGASDVERLTIVVLGAHSDPPGGGPPRLLATVEPVGCGCATGRDASGLAVLTLLLAALRRGTRRAHGTRQRS